MQWNVLSLIKFKVSGYVRLMQISPPSRLCRSLTRPSLALTHTCVPPMLLIYGYGAFSFFPTFFYVVLLLLSQIQIWASPNPVLVGLHTYGPWRRFRFHCVLLLYMVFFPSFWAAYFPSCIPMEFPWGSLIYDSCIPQIGPHPSLVAFLLDFHLSNFFLVQWGASCVSSLSVPVELLVLFMFFFFFFLFF